MYNVLIIDDEPWARKVVKELGDWERLSLKVVGEANDGSNGINLMDGLSPDIVITDMRMPGIDGIELLRKTETQHTNIKVIVMSGHTDLHYLKQAIRSRAVEYLVKPIDPYELNAALERCVCELDQQKKKACAPIYFSDQADLKRYLAFRQQVYESLLELNKASVLRLLGQINGFLACLAEPDTANHMDRIGHDFILMLQEFCSGEGVSFEDIWNTGHDDCTLKQGWDSLEDVMSVMRELFAKTIDAMEANRRKGSSLDLQEVQAYLDRHFRDMISLDLVAQNFFISKEYLCRAFKGFSGESLMDYLTRKRMEEAKRLIVDHCISIKRTAELMGYSDVAYFHRVFKKYFGITPRQMYESEYVNKMQRLKTM